MKAKLRRLKILPRWVIISIDLAVIGFSTLLGYLLRFNFNLADLYNYHFWNGLSLSVGLGLLSIIITSSYKGIIRYTGLEDGVRIFYMVVLNALLLSGANLVYYYNARINIIPYSVILISLLSSFLFLFNYRLLVKYLFSYYRHAVIKRVRVLIFGAGQTGIVTRHVVSSTPRMQVAGFLEDDPHKIGKVLDGIKIYDGRDLESLFEELEIDELIIATKDLSMERKNELVDACLRGQVKVRTIPPVEKWVRGELSLNQIKEINIDDLLGREVIYLNNPNLEGEIRGKRILVTGAAGSIGSELVRQVIRYAPELVILVDQAESPLYEIERELKVSEYKPRAISVLADITNRDRMNGLFETFKPQLVFHAAAYKHVPMMEGNPSESISCNVLGTKVVADLAVNHQVKKFVMISTDKAVNPTSVMGCSKRIAEIYVQALNSSLEALGTTGRTAFITTRFGNVLGSNGSVIPLFRRQIQEGGPITVTHPEITRYFMTIPEACRLVLEAAVMGKGGEIFVFDMGKSVRILDLAHRMIQLSGLEPGRDIDIVFTGLREGEKLYEELLTSAEDTLPTHHEKILIARNQQYSFDEVNRLVDLFHDLVHDRNELKMVALMKELVPEYKSNYSRYEVLDKVG
ncbi:MAG: polysaccharide biosynthesis protein [Bacteroidota bacterium]